MQTMATGSYLSSNVLEGGEEQSFSHNRKEWEVPLNQRKAFASCLRPSVFLIRHSASLSEDCPRTFV